jgi:hypothetical protein
MSVLIGPPMSDAAILLKPRELGYEHPSQPIASDSNSLIRAFLLELHAL